MRKLVDQKLYDAVKIMLDNGASVSETVKYMGISNYTIYSIKNTENFTEYKNFLVARSLERKKAKEKSAVKETDAENALAEQKNSKPTQVVEHRQNVTVQTTYYVSQKLDKLCELLTAISAKLAFIVEELTK